VEYNKESRPKTVDIAVNLLYGTLGIGMLRVFWENPVQQTNKLVVGFSVFITIFVFAFMVLLIFKIGKGRNWARVTFLILFVIGIPLSVPVLLLTFSKNPFFGIINIIQILLQLAAMVLLFQKRSSDWYKNMKR